ncbi:MAG: hypothetical protein V4615_05160 [Bacteroidota bacterium]
METSKLTPIENPCDAPLKDGATIEQEPYNPYCPMCDACGETGCCPPQKCKQHPDGHYCENYLTELKEGWVLHNRLLNKIDEQPERYKALLEWFAEEEEKYSNEPNPQMERRK